MRLLKNCVCTVAFGVMVASPVAALENRYDLLGRLIVPIAAVFAQQPERAETALTANVVIKQFGRQNANEDLNGAKVEVLFENPDRLLMRLHLRDGVLTICRDGQRIWAAPAQLVRKYATANGVTLEASGTGSRPMPAMTLPFSGAQLALLPAIFRVTDVEVSETNRVVDLTPAPEIATALRMNDGRARLWIGNGDKLQQIQLAGAGMRLTIGLEDIFLFKKLPPETWSPKPGEESVELPAERLFQML